MWVKRLEKWMPLILFIYSLAEGQGDERCNSPQYLEYGHRGTIHCLFQDFFSLFWYNTTDILHTDPIIFLRETEKHGTGFSSGEFDVHPNGSLIINIVSMQHNLNFTAIKMISATDKRADVYKVMVIVKVYPKKANLVVEGCSCEGECILKRHDGNNITCSLQNVHPMVHLEFLASPEDYSRIKFYNEELSYTYSDGLFSVTITSLYQTDAYDEKSVSLECKTSGPNASIINLRRKIEIATLNDSYHLGNTEKRSGMIAVVGLATMVLIMGLLLVLLMFWRRQRVAGHTSKQETAVNEENARTNGNSETDRDERRDDENPAQNKENTTTNEDFGIDGDERRDDENTAQNKENTMTNEDFDIVQDDEPLVRKTVYDYKILRVDVALKATQLLSSIRDIKASMELFSKSMMTLYGEAAAGIDSKWGRDFNTLRDEVRNASDSYARDVLTLANDLVKLVQKLFKTCTFVQFDFWFENIVDVYADVNSCNKMCDKLVKTNVYALKSLEEKANEFEKLIFEHDEQELAPLFIHSNPQCNANTKYVVKKNIIPSITKLFCKFEEMQSFFTFALALLVASEDEKHRSSVGEIFYSVLEERASDADDCCKEFLRKMPGIISDLRATYPQNE